MNLLDQMLRQLLNIVNMINGLVVVSNSNDFVISFSLIFHSHDSNDFGINKTQYFQFNTTKYQYIEWIVIISIGHGDKSIISRVVDCTEENSV